MTYARLSVAASALKEVEKLNLPFLTSRKIFFVARDINSEIEFYISEENKLLQKYHARRTDDGTVTFDSPNDLENYIAEMKILNNTDVTISNIPLILSEKDFENVFISPEALINLEGVIEFE